MNQRIVLQLQNDEPEEAPAGEEARSAVVRLLVREPEGHAGIWAFDCVRDEAVFAALDNGGDGDVVAAAGRRLFQELSGKAVVSNLLTAAMQTPVTDRRPIYFDVSGADACQELPWESLCADDGTFLALDRWPVARMLASTAGAVTVRRLSSPLRITAMLACLGVDPLDEWEALRKAVEATPLDVEVQLILSDPALYDELKVDKPSWAVLEQVPLEYPELQRLVTTFEPHLLHFFCHGETAGGPHLQIATAAASGVGDDIFNIHRLEADGIRELVRQPKESPWAVVLNACSTNETPGESGARSLASALVRDHGLQAVIGMREPVRSTDAANFTGPFYRSLFAEVQSCAGGGELDWAASTVDARTELIRNRDVLPSAAAGRYREWILPVVTVRLKPFMLDVTAPAVPLSEQERLFEIFKAAMLANLPATTPEGTVAAFRPDGESS